MRTVQSFEFFNWIHQIKPIVLDVHAQSPGSRNGGIVPGPSRAQRLLSSLLVALCGFWGGLEGAQALTMVVTPGSSASYLYFPPASTSSGSGSGTSNNSSNSTAVVVAGVGGVSLTKSGGYIAYSVSVINIPSNGQTSALSSPCGTGCALGQFNSGAGFVTLQSSRPTTFTDIFDKPLSNCTAVLNCTTWVNTNTTLQLKSYPNCFEGDYALNANFTCSTKTTPDGINQFYGTNLAPLGLFGGLLSGRLVIYTLMPNLANWESTQEVLSGKYGVAVSSSEGVKNKVAIQSVYKDKSIEDACTPLGSTWVVPSDVELKLFVNLLPFNYYWTSNDSSPLNALAVFSQNQATFSLQKDSMLGLACVRIFTL
jgi:hypothetical protein